jgi:hypothetical protein
MCSMAKVPRRPFCSGSRCPSPAIMDQYSFNWNAIQLVEAATLAALNTRPILDVTSHVDLMQSTPRSVKPGFAQPLRSQKVAEDVF